MGIVEVRPHRIDCELFKPGTKVRRTVLYAGRISPEKQVDLIVHAAMDVGQINLTIVGGDRVVDYLFVQGRRNTKILWKTAQPKKHLAEIMGKSDIVCLPSRYEQASKVLLESMASECLVIATHEASRGVIVDGRTGYLCLPTVDSLSAAIRLALTDPLSDWVRKAAREYVLRCHAV